MPNFYLLLLLLDYPFRLFLVELDVSVSFLTHLLQKEFNVRKASTAIVILVGHKLELWPLACICLSSSGTDR